MAGNTLPASYNHLIKMQP